MSLAKSILAFAALPLLVNAAVVDHPIHDHTTGKILPGRWYHDEDHPVHALFKRGSTNDNIQYAAVGSAAWSAAFPQGSPDPSQYPKEWTDTLNAAVAAGKIPNIPVSNESGGNNPTYPDGQDPNGPAICSATYKCQNLLYDIWDAPNGYVGIGFDDGPLPPSDKLYDFLQSNNQSATHFMIGTNILNNGDRFTKAFDTLKDDIAVHTWTHPYMTSLSNQAVLGELGWTMEIVHNSTGGRLPRFWRPPYGDADNRVRAIAKEVFGLTTIVWNQDTEDWSLGESGGTSMQAISDSMNKWLSGSKSPGLIILEHELSDNSVQAFMDAYPIMKSNGWNLTSVARLNGTSAWQNSDSATGPVALAGVVAGGAISNTTVAPPPSSTSSSSSASSSGSSSGSASKPASSGGAAASPTHKPNSGTPRMHLAGGVVVGALVAALSALLA